MMTQVPTLDDVLDELSSGSFAGTVRRDAPLGAMTTYRVGGAAAALVTLDSSADADRLLAALRGKELPIVAVGRGSNLLVADEGFPGLAVALGAGFDTIVISPPTVEVGAAAKLPVLARATVDAGLRGLEWAVGVPGSVGGAVRMNAGGHGAETVDTIVAAEVADLRAGVREWRERGALAFGYRTSSIGPTDLVLTARFALEPGDPAAGKAEMTEIVRWRRANQPGGQNAGSVFTNPTGDSAGRLIETAGGKGLRVGTAEVSTKHANFIQADEGGRAGDVRALMTEVRRLVLETHGVDLQPETHLIGFDPEETPT